MPSNNQEVIDEIFRLFKQAKADINTFDFIGRYYSLKKDLKLLNLQAIPNPDLSEFAVKFKASLIDYTFNENIKKIFELLETTRIVVTEQMKTIRRILNKRVTTKFLYHNNTELERVNAHTKILWKKVNFKECAQDTPIMIKYYETVRVLLRKIIRKLLVQKQPSQELVFMGKLAEKILILLPLRRPVPEQTDEIAYSNWKDVFTLFDVEIKKRSNDELYKIVHDIYDHYLNSSDMDIFYSKTRELFESLHSMIISVKNPVLKTYVNEFLLFNNVDNHSDE